mmetsp:Transcript_25237/g.69693  ORF Transcript_25237/g.69693 Transcript_25237/m.69693 type:complete len:793 (-) Transcript_25237:114-2492(-)
MFRLVLTRTAAARSTLFNKTTKPMTMMMPLRALSSVTVPPAPTSNHYHTPLPDAQGSIIYTECDEAPALATFSLYPIISKFSSLSNVDIVPCDISVAGRILAAFPEFLEESQRIPDNLSYLGEMALQPTCSIVKLPNISAPVNQLQDCIAELRGKGYNVPLFPTEPKTPEEQDIQQRYNKIAGSAVNPVLREGNSDRRVAPPVKAYAQKNPHRMGMWSKASRTHVAHMTQGDFFASEQSVIMEHESSVEIVLEGSDGQVTVLKEDIPLLKDEVIDSSFMSVKQLQDFYETEIQDAKDADLMLSLHLKATMMKVSDPILFGHCIRVYFKDAFAKYGDFLDEIGANPNSGLASMFDVIKAKANPAKATEILDAFDACYETRPWLAMVNSDKGITNLHAPNDIIIDASMPVVVRDSGKMWNKLGELEDTKCLIPDRSYATAYQEVISFVKTNGQFDPATMGHVPNVGLMAKKAEEYGSHDKTFEIPAEGHVYVKDKSNGKVLMEHKVEAGDIWRMCQTKDVAIKDWVRLAVERARSSGARAIFWLDRKRAHDKNLINIANVELEKYSLDGVDISFMRPVDAARISCQRAMEGKDTISVTGNVFRDYLTDLFPILELGTSAKMLSIVPLLAGGGLYETGAGGSAPKHVQQFVKENHLRWDSLGEYLAMAVCYEKLADIAGNPKAKLLGESLNKAVGRILDNRKTPSRVVNQIDNRATNYYVALYWADFLQQEDESYKPVFEALSANRSKIVEEFAGCQGDPVDLGGYYLFDAAKAKSAMNPSPTLNKILSSFGPDV